MNKPNAPLLPPADCDYPLVTDRLRLEPITTQHADELWHLLNDPSLHEFVPYEITSLEKQRERCQGWSERRSPDGDEIWLNWLGRLKETDKGVAHFQVGVTRDGVANLGYVVATMMQNQGIGTEGISAIVDYLKNIPTLTRIQASSDVRNHASHRLLKKIGFVQSQFIANADFFHGQTSDEWVFSLPLQKAPHWQPRLSGRRVQIRPILLSDFEELRMAAADPLIWEQHPEKNRWQPKPFQKYFQAALDSQMAFALVDRETGNLVGSTRYHAFDPESASVEIGYTFLIRSLWGTSFNRECKALLIDHAFQYVDLVLFVIGKDNTRSQKAVEKIGAQRSGSRSRPLKEGTFQAVCVYKLSRADWQNRNQPGVTL